MGLQARGRVADSEIRTENKPPAGPLFVDLSVLTQQAGTRTDLKTSRRCSFFFFFFFNEKIKMPLTEEIQPLQSSGKSSA